VKTFTHESTLLEPFSAGGVIRICASQKYPSYPHLQTRHSLPPSRNTVAERLRNDPNPTPEAMKDALFLDFIHSLTRHPDRTLVFAVDALAECGGSQSRPGLLKVLTDAAAQVP